ncbi:MAG: hypothetical protein PHE14_08705 [Aminobacterium colombiense]|jgi:hypothetical protein|nr:MULTISPECIES: hypothetical protein [Aminobacterium]MDD2378278.1 hypothetical protein [Aminobacterium colombiense]MDD3768801.1 hypothetical protein [Aminobacterium colombiense]MDD4266497.1 hypothetical protein [Aminobacterium colombiense]MDD4585136.1 hypothetical protein [Aminobacterium colombiense]
MSHDFVSVISPFSTIVIPRIDGLHLFSFAASKSMAEKLVI